MGIGAVRLAAKQEVAIKSKRIIIAILSLAAVLVVTMAAYVNYSLGHQEDALQRSDDIVESARIDRKVDGTKWVYTVDQNLEQKFEIAVTYPRSQEPAELVISGRGCNMVSAKVSRGNIGKDASETRIIAGDEYSLGHTTSTLMACPDDMEDRDLAVSKEISRIFQSLSRQ